MKTSLQKRKSSKLLEAAETKIVKVELGESERKQEMSANKSGFFSFFKCCMSPKASHNNRNIKYGVPPPNHT